MVNNQNTIKLFEQMAKKYGTVSAEEKQTRYIKDAQRAHLTTPEERLYINTSEV